MTINAHPPVSAPAEAEERPNSNNLMLCAATAFSASDFLLSRSLYTDVLLRTPYHLPAYIERSIVHTKLGYTDLAIGDAYRALLLGDHLREYDAGDEAQQENEDEQEEEEVGKVDIGKEAWLTLVAYLASTKPKVTTNLQVKEEINKLDAKTLRLLVTSLRQVECYEDALRFVEFGVRRFKKDGGSVFKQEKKEVQKHLDGRSGVLRKSKCRRELYSWNHYEPDRFAPETIEFLNSAMARSTSKAEVKSVELPILTKNTSNDTKPRTTKQLGVFATQDIFVDEIFFEESSALAVVCDPEYSKLCEYCTESLGEDWVFCEDCWEGDEDSGLTWCSVECRQKAMEKYHPALCGKDFGFLFRSINTSQTDASVYFILLLKVFAMSLTQNVHPLLLPEIKYLYGVTPPEPQNPERPELPFSFKNQVLHPISFLEEFEVDVFSQKALEFFDLWVLQTVLAKMMGVASARMSFKTKRTEVAAVHTLYSLFNHSCTPNATWECEGTVKYTALAPPPSALQSTGIAVKSGEEIYSHYCDVSLGYKERQDIAWGSLGGKCRCERCVREEKEDLERENVAK